MQSDEFLFSNSETADIEGLVKSIHKSNEHIPGLIFNYPPFRLWESPSNYLFGDAIQSVADGLWPEGNRYSANLYVHIPFCKQKCSFCYYSVLPGGSEDSRQNYLDALEKEAIAYRRTSMGHREFDTVFIGGGTPSELSAEQLRFLFEKVIYRFDLSNCREITLECAPSSITKEKLAVASEFGVTRISMGVQSLASSVLERTRRDSDVNEILNVYENIAHSGVPKINIDLIAGVGQESQRDMENTCDTLESIERRPDQVTMFTLSIRKGSIDNKTLRAIEASSQYSESLSLYNLARERLGAMGYWQYSRNLFPSGDSVFLYQDNIWGKNGSVLALGASGYSHSEHYVYQNAFGAREYVAAINSGKSPVAHALRLSLEDQMDRHVCLAFKHKVFDKRAFSSFYPEGRAIDRYEPRFVALDEAGVVDNGEFSVKYTSAGIAEADRYCRLFYSDKVNGRLYGFSGVEKPMKNAFKFVV